jgi:hypothetical protein
VRNAHIKRLTAGGGQATAWGFNFRVREVTGKDGDGKFSVMILSTVGFLIVRMVLGLPG